MCFFTGTMSVLAGAERATAVLANALARRGWRVHIICQWGETCVYPLEPGVTLHTMYAQRRAFKASYLQVVRRLRSFVRTHQVDTVVAVDTQLAWFSIPALAGLGVGHVAWEHAQFAQDLGRRSRRLARRFAARWCDAVVVLTDSDRGQWLARTPAGARVVTQVNPLTIEAQAAAVDLSQTRVLAVGRLEHVKGFDLLLQAWCRVQASQAGWTLRVVGDGSQRDALLELRDRLGMQASVELMPATPDIVRHYRQASVLALSSRHEGFGLVLTEAMACGLAIVSFACETGPRELLADGSTAILAAPEDVDALAQALLRVMQSEPLRQHLSGNARTEARRFDPDRVAARWEQLLAHASPRLRGRGGVDGQPQNYNR